MLLAIDPGRQKCGWALVEADGRVADRGVAERGQVLALVAGLAARYPLDRLVLGDRTGHRELLRELMADPRWRGCISLVDESRSSEEARLRCVRATARGWRRLIPATLRSPSGPYDDYVAVILAERFLKNGGVPSADAAPFHKEGTGPAPGE